MTAGDAEPRTMVGTQVTVDVERVAHGGWCIARNDGRVVLVRHTLPGERVVARITEGDETSRFWRADAVEVLVAAADRVAPPCPFAGPGACGGCDWQHVSVPGQRTLKTLVVREQFRRLAGLEVGAEVEPVRDDDGLGWRTRVRFAVDDSGRAGFRRHRSHEVLPVDDCLIAHPEVAAPDVLARSWGEADAVSVAVSNRGERTVWTQEGRRRSRATRISGAARLREDVGERTWRVSAEGFWQVHPRAATTLLDTVIDAAQVEPGDRVLDLYSGVGLFAGPLGTQVGEAGAVVAVESSTDAVRDARRNLHHQPQVELLAERVDRALTRTLPDRADVVVLDPPRTGARANVVQEIATRAPRTVVYVGCDPAALARDVATFARHGYRLVGLRAFDLFPMTHHVECVATLHPA
ncbi:MAG TPA: class I SAM-dependent RNA methyltransferase [Jiangellaceae bacterium]|nr:class I SAM-dependent RNA methyltransferase [Jiangellaceae bacterium]